MPVVHFHFTDTPAHREAGPALLRDACALYAEVLGAPVERIRAFATPHPPSLFLVGGQLCSDGGLDAPFFDFIVMDGRTLADRHRLMRDFTELCVRHLGARAQDVRGICRRVPAEDWGIGGVPASELRRAEIEARAREAAKDAST